MSLFVKGFGIFTDAYDLFVMNIVNVVLDKRYDEYSNQKQWVSSSALFGAILGQLILGSISDYLGRRLLMIVSVSLLVLGGLLCTLSYTHNADNNIVPFIVSLSISRLILGIGIGAEYPLSASSSYESENNTSKQTKNVSLVFSLQGIGNIFAALVANILIQILALEKPYTNAHLELIWRLLFGM